MSVLPGDSVSLSGGSSSLTSVILPYDIDLSKCVFTADDYLRVIEAAGPVEASAFRRFMEEQLRFLKQCANANSSAVRVASVQGSVASSQRSGSQPSSPVGSAGSRLAALRRMSSWRSKSVPEGLCYSKLLRNGSVSMDVDRLGKWPTLSAVLRTSVNSFQSVSDLAKFRLVGDSDAVHVESGGMNGFPFLASAVEAAKSVRYPEGTLGAVLKAHGSFPGPAMSLTGRTCVGGMLSAEKLPFVLPQYRGALVEGPGQVGFSDLLMLPSDWFVPLKDVNSLWLSPRSFGVNDSYRFSLCGTVHFASLLISLARDVCREFPLGTWGHVLANSFLPAHALPIDNGLPSFSKSVLSLDTDGFLVLSKGCAETVSVVTVFDFRGFDAGAPVSDVTSDIALGPLTQPTDKVGYAHQELFLPSWIPFNRRSFGFVVPSFFSSAVALKFSSEVELLFSSGWIRTSVAVVSAGQRLLMRAVSPTVDFSFSAVVAVGAGRGLSADWPVDQGSLDTASVGSFVPVFERVVADVFFGGRFQRAISVKGLSGVVFMVAEDLDYAEDYAGEVSGNWGEARRYRELLAQLESFREEVPKLIPVGREFSPIYLKV